MKRLVIYMIALMLSLPSLAPGAQPRPVPELALTTLDAGTVSGSELASTSRWLLVYITGDQAVDRDLICALQAFSGDPSAGKVAVVVPGVTAAELKALAASHDKLADLRWFADTDRSAAKALQLSGYNIVLGGEGTTIRWDASGVGKEQDALRSLLVDWLR